MRCGHIALLCTENAKVGGYEIIFYGNGFKDLRGARKRVAALRYRFRRDSTHIAGFLALRDSAIAGDEAVSDCFAMG